MVQLRLAELVVGTEHGKIEQKKIKQKVARFTKPLTLTFFFAAFAIFCKSILREV